MRFSASAMAMARSRVELDDLDLGGGAPRLQRVGDELTDIAAAGDDDALGHRLLVAEDTQRAHHLLARAHDIDLVADQHGIGRARHEQIAAAHDADDDRLQVGKQLGELRQRRIDHRAVLVAADADHDHLAIGELDRVEGAGQLKTAQHHTADLDLRRDDHVDRQVLGREQVGPVRLEIALRADAGDLGGHVEQRVGHLAGDHVDLVVERHGDDHVRLLGAGLGEHLRVGAVADEAAHVERVTDRLDKLWRGVDHRNVVVLDSETFGDAVADLAGSADDNAHDTPNPWPCS